jgi:hypothetical protein
MSKSNSIFLFHTHEGQPLRRGTMTVTPQAQVIGLHLPFAALVWNRPIGVTVTDEIAGTSQYYPITDITRLVQWGLYALIPLLLGIQLLIRTKKADLAAFDVKHDA